MSTVAKPSRWIPLFKSFIKDLRISSKEIASTDERGSKLEMWDSQNRFVENVGQGLDDGIRTFNCLKSRQLGITTISLAIDTFWLAIHSIIGCLVSDTEKNRDINRAIIKRYVESFPEGYFGDEFRIVKDNRQMLLFSNNSRLDLLVAGTKQKSTAWAEGQGYAFAHMTEVASYGSPEGLASLEEAFAQTNPNRLFIYESTAKGFNHWRDKWLAGVSNPYTEKSFFIGWWASDVNIIPRSDARFAQFGGYAASGEERELVAAVARLYNHKITPEQLAWIRWKEVNAGQEQDLLVQNQPWTAEQAFVQTGYSFFQVRALSKDMKKVIDGAEEEYGYQAYRYEMGSDFFDMSLEKLGDEDEEQQIELKIWEEPHEDGQYAIGFDPAFGRNDHKDRHAIVIWRCYADKLIQVAEYATSRVEVKHASWVLAHLAGAYKNCMVNIELGGPGRMVMSEWDHLVGMMNAEMNAKYLAQKPSWDNALGSARWYLYHRADSPGKGYANNFETNWRTMMELMHQFRGAYVTKELEIKSLYLLKEMALVIVDGGHIGAPESRSENSKDDRVFAAALGVRAWLDWIRKDMLANGLTYERVTMEAAGTATAASRSLNGIIYRFLQTQQQLAEEPQDDYPKWRRDRGI